ncbi:MAG TPA: hypothetical protein VKV05_03470 [Terriglobales bacterium]|nr:hypothetical protein [Terriglobales bacterium]
MPRLSLLVALVLMAATAALAQAGIGYSSAAAAQDENPQVVRTPAGSQTTVVRGCLSGSPDNYTLTDPNGMQYRIAGDAPLLRSLVGHEVEITASESRASGGSRAATNGLQTSDVRSVANRCNRGSSVSAPLFPANNGANPQNAPETAPPPKR